MSLSLNIESIILLLFFIAPGFLFTRTYTAYRPRYYRAPNNFTQFVLAIVGSTVIHAALLTLVALGLLIYWVIVGMPMVPNNLFAPPAALGSYSFPALALAMLITIAYLGLSLVLARRFATFLGRQTGADRPRWWQLIMGVDPPEPTLLWHTVLQIEPYQLNLIPPHLTLQLRTGEYFEGDLHRIRLVGDEDNTVELALRKVFYRAVPATTKDKADPAAPNLKPLPNQVILLKSTDILWLTRDDIPQ